MRMHPIIRYFHLVRGVVCVINPCLTLLEFDDQNNECLARPPLPLSHHLSLPTSTMEKLLQDSVHLNVRAKRGCATHPRSIAERVNI